MKNDDTMISILGGGHVRRRSVGSIIEASPCRQFRANESPNKSRIVEKPSIASTSSFQFGGELMIKARLTEELLDQAVPVFTRSGPATRSRSSTCTSSSGSDTPPLLASDGSSISGGSQPNIDLSHINIALSNTTHLMSTVTRNNVRARAPADGAGHRCRYSKSHASTLFGVRNDRGGDAEPGPHKSCAFGGVQEEQRQAVFVVDSDTASLRSKPEESVWDDERVLLWSDTPFFIPAIQSFQAPGSLAGMQARTRWPHSRSLQHTSCSRFDQPAYLNLKVALESVNSGVDTDVYVLLSRSDLISASSFATYIYATGGKGDLEIYVYPNDVDPDMGEIGLVKNSRVALTVGTVILHEIVVTWDVVMTRLTYGSHLDMTALYPNLPQGSVCALWLETGGGEVKTDWEGNAKTPTDHKIPTTSVLWSSLSSIVSMCLDYLARCRLRPTLMPFTPNARSGSDSFDIFQDAWEV
ncbi:hypothetical protein CVT25_005271 [Psilocybe cyanescens]|uniref:Uncharacterized protein n=1 Tax=Psilocybe cyanescens TaxID=93625 RepID=A0A409XDS2_PSICY|nr:hypothetical protein CVT25_005271 [Psilocybe cyanescens]